MLRRGSRLIASLTGLSLLATSVCAQEVVPLLRLKHWQARGVCVGVQQCAFCSASATAPSGPELRITPPDGIAVFFADGSEKPPIAIEIGAKRWPLTLQDGDTFAIASADAAGVIGDMQHAPEIVVHAGSGDARYPLAEFPRAYAAILDACHGAK
jgi:hypothetical protein